MTATNPATQTVPTPEAIQQALVFLKNFAEQKQTADENGKPDPNSFFNSDIFRTIESVLKNSAEAKPKPVPAKDGQEDDDEDVECECADEDDEDEEDEEDENRDYDLGDVYWHPGPEWKTIGLVAGGAALVGLGVLLYKMFDD